MDTKVPLTEVPFPKSVIIETYKTREEWLAARVGRPWRVNASEVAALYGESKYATPYSMAMERLHPEVERKASNPDVVAKGHRWEKFIVEQVVLDLEEMYRDQGLTFELVALPQYCCFHNTDFPELSCTPDAIVAAYDPLGVLKFYAPVEVKKVRFNMKDEWEGEPPVAYQMQAQAQMLCIGAEVAFLGGMISDELTVMRMERHEDLLEDVCAEAVRFLTNLNKGILPPVDGEEATTQALRTYYKGVGEQAIECGVDFADIVRAYDAAKKRLEVAKDEVEAIGNTIKAQLGEATLCTFPGGKVTWKQQGGRESRVEVDLKHLSLVAEAGIPHVVAKTPVSRPMRYALKG